MSAEGQSHFTGQVLGDDLATPTVESGDLGCFVPHPLPTPRNSKMISPQEALALQAVTDTLHLAYGVLVTLVTLETLKPVAGSLPVSHQVL